MNSTRGIHLAIIATMIACSALAFGVGLQARARDPWWFALGLLVAVTGLVVAYTTYQQLLRGVDLKGTTLNRLSRVLAFAAATACILMILRVST